MTTTKTFYDRYNRIKIGDIVLSYWKGIWRVTGFHEVYNHMQVDLERLCDSQGNPATHLFKRSSCSWMYIRPFTEEMLTKWKEFDNRVYEKIKAACGF